MHQEAPDVLARLLSEAVPTLGFSRVALGCGVEPTALRRLIRSDRAARMPPQWVGRVLSRLESWTEWVDGYRDELEEVRRLQRSRQLDLGRMNGEARHRLDHLRTCMTETQVALGCELPRSLLEYWRLGGLRDRHAPLLAKGLGHLRFSDTWPVPRRSRR